MANAQLTPTAVTREALRILHQKLNFIGSINRQYDDQYAQSGAKIGDSLKIRLPNQYSVRTGKTLDVQDNKETSVTMTVATQKGVDVNFSSAELTMELDDFSDRVLDPAMSVLAANIESDALSMYKDIPHEVSDVAASITFADILEGRKVLTDNLAPTGDGRALLLNTQDHVDLVNALNGNFNPTGAISAQYRDGYIGQGIAGYKKVFENTLLPAHTTGTETANTWRTDIAAAEADGTSTFPSDGGSLHIDTGNTSFKKGDIIEIEDVYDVHPETKETRAKLKRFVVTADFSGAAEGDLSIYPAIVASGARQNVSAAAADGKTIYKRESDRSTAVGASADYFISLGYHRDAFSFATADLVMPKGVDFASRQVMDGISMRIVRDYDINNDNLPCRIDVLYGYKTIRPEFAVRYGFN